MKIIPLFLLVSILITPLCNAGTCTQGLIRALKEEGLSDQQVELICKKVELYDQLGSEQTIDPYTKALRV
jgi:hypothetical protein